MIGPENMFGKVRGRFDEAGARHADRTLVDAALAALVAMPPAEMDRFVHAFNRVFRQPGRGYRISARCEETIPARVLAFNPYSPPKRLPDLRDEAGEENKTGRTA